jgi:hypothetical protein
MTPHRSEESLTMTDIFKPINDDRQGAAAPGYEPAAPGPEAANETGRTLLVGVLGGVLSAAGYLVYSRLPDEQKDKLHAQVRQLVESRVNELRGRFNI